MPQAAQFGRGVRTEFLPYKVRRKTFTFVAVWLFLELFSSYSFGTKKVEQVTDVAKKFMKLFRK